MTMNQYFDKRLADIISVNDNQLELFSYIFQKLKRLGYVEESFLSALRDREQVYPTGLKTPFLGVAIPHTDPQHIKKPFIYMIKLQQPIEFGQMGSEKEKVTVHYVFVLGFQKGEHQLVLLQYLMTMFSNEATMNKLADLTTEEDLFDVVSHYFTEQKGSEKQ